MKKTNRSRRREFKRILVPVDFSDLSLEALRTARDLAGGEKSRITVLHVAEPLHIDWRTDTADLQKEAQSVARNVLEKFVRAEFGSAGPKQIFMPGSPVDGILACANKLKADLIVVGTQGRTGLPHALIGSVAERVVRHAPCPVLVVR